MYKHKRYIQYAEIEIMELSNFAKSCITLTYVSLDCGEGRSTELYL